MERAVGSALGGRSRCGRGMPETSVAAERRFVGAGRAGNVPAKSVLGVVSGAHDDGSVDVPSLRTDLGVPVFRFPWLSLIP